LRTNNGIPHSRELPQETDAVETVVCPVCHRSTPASNYLCIHCWTNRLLHEPVSEPASERYRALERGVEERERRRFLVRKNLKYAAALLVLAFLAWWTYSTFF